MTIFGIDISNNNGADIDLAQVKAEGFDFVFCKVTEGDYFVDSTWPGYRDAARAAGLLLAGYHYLRGDCDVRAQAELFVAQLGDEPVAAMIDFEANSGGIDVFWAFVNEVNRLGREIHLSYIPRWYWRQIGQPDLSKVPGLIQSSYVLGRGYASALYPGSGTSFWSGFGGRSPDILQFNDAATVAGHSVDANAFEGSLADLSALLGYSPAPTSGGFLMALTDAQQAELFSKVSDIWEQLRGPEGNGWPQLGKTDKGLDRTPVDALSALLSQKCPVAVASTAASAAGTGKAV